MHGKEVKGPLNHKLNYYKVKLGTYTKLHVASPCPLSIVRTCYLGTLGNCDIQSTTFYINQVYPSTYLPTSPKEIIEIIFSITAQQYQCSHCSRRYANERLLRDHVRHHINHYKCPECDMTVPNKSTLVAHVRYRHRKDKPHKCLQCGKG